jgi:site-specific recombinase XerD
MISGTAISTDLRDLASDFQRHLSATNRSPRTNETYLKALNHFINHQVTHGETTIAAAVRRSHIERWVADILAHNRASTASVRFRALRVFWNWAVDEEEVEKSPMARMKQPIVPIDLPPVLTDDDLSRLLATCRGRTPMRLFETRRDLAILRLLIDTGSASRERWNDCPQ